MSSNFVQPSVRIKRKWKKAKSGLHEGGMGGDPLWSPEK